MLYNQLEDTDIKPFCCILNYDGCCRKQALSLSCELNQLLFSWDTDFTWQVTGKQAVIIQTWYVADIFMKISDMEPCFKENK